MPAAYVGQLDMNELFPNLQYYLTTTVSFCESNRQNIQAACSIGAGTQTFANSSLLLSACASFLTDGKLSSLAQASTQIVVACSILSVQMSLLCSSQEFLNCDGGSLPSLCRCPQKWSLLSRFWMSPCLLAWLFCLIFVSMSAFEVRVSIAAWIVS